MISANVVAASECIINNPRSGRKATSRIVSMEVVMPRFILAEFNTHRMFSRNSASSRAIPARKIINAVRSNPFIPIAWMKDHSGMQGTEYLDNLPASQLDSNLIDGFTGKELFEGIWAREGQWEHPDGTALFHSLDYAGRLNQLGVSKQICNRLLEPFMWHKVLVTSTDWDNFFELRCPQYEYINHLEQVLHFKSKKAVLDYLHWEDNEWRGRHNYGEKHVEMQGWSDLQWLQINKGMSEIHMMALAEAMYDAYNQATFRQLQQGEYHIPYGDNIDDRELLKAMYEGKDIDPGSVIGAELTAGRVAVAIARCARLSYQTLGDEPKIDYVADLDLYRRLVQSGHMSPSEHVARAMDEREYWSYGKTIMYDKRPKQLFGYLNNFQGFIQQRILIENIYE